MKKLPNLKKWLQSWKQPQQVLVWEDNLWQYRWVDRWIQPHRVPWWVLEDNFKVILIFIIYFSFISIMGLFIVGFNWLQKKRIDWWNGYLLHWLCGDKKVVTVWNVIELDLKEFSAWDGWFLFFFGFFFVLWCFLILVKEVIDLILFVKLKNTLTEMYYNKFITYISNELYNLQCIISWLIIIWLWL